MATFNQGGPASQTPVQKQTQFTPVSQDRIRAEALKGFEARRAEATKMGLKMAKRYFFGGCLAFILIPILGVISAFVIFFAWLGAIAMLGALMWFRSRQLATPDEQKGAMHVLRLMCEGPCPICGKKLILTPNTDPTHFTCPSCHVRSRLENGVATPT